VQEFRIPIGPHSVTAWRVGAGEPLLVVHGGPGVPCSYVYHAHTRYAEQGFEVASWDQLGCGRSDRPDDASLWTIERYVEEVEQVRRHLNWDRFLLLGNSWGGILSIEYCLRYQQHVKALVVGNMGSDMTLISAGFDRVKAALGAETVRMMALREAAGTTSHPEYLAARTLIMQRHMLRMEEWPKPVLDAMEGIGNGPFVKMFGPHFYSCTGSLRAWNRTADLARIKLPVLFTTSEWDYILPDYVRLAHEQLPGSRLVIFSGSGHMPFWDAADRYHPAVLDFLRRHR
jgi:proline iminopeptidase